MTKLQELQRALNDFDRKNYPGNNTVKMTLGIVEECGELWEALCSFNKKEIKNALADIIVFSMQLASFEKIDWEKNYIQVKRKCEDRKENELGIQVGRLCHHVLKREQGLGRDSDHFRAIKQALGRIGREVEYIANTQSVNWMQNYIDVVENEVLKRNRKEREAKYRTLK